LWKKIQNNTITIGSSRYEIRAIDVQTSYQGDFFGDGAIRKVFAAGNTPIDTDIIMEFVQR
jgi:hypothetical protein